MPHSDHERERFIFSGEPGNGEIHRIIWIEGGIITTWSEVGFNLNEPGWSWAGSLEDFKNLFVKI